MSNAQPVGPNERFPTTLTSLFGREREVETVCELIRTNTRLVTLLGPGGVGKTRLAIEIANSLRPVFNDGICYVPLSPFTNPDLVVPTIARAIGLRDRGAQTPWDALIAHLKARQFLLVLDNFEQVAAAAPMLAKLLTASPSLRVLVTSRAVLGLSIEREFQVLPLDLTDPAESQEFAQIADSPAVRLFVARANAVRPDFELSEDIALDVAEICHWLDGLPLAIELAAVQIRHLSPLALRERLGQRLPLLGRGPRDQPERLRTMRDAIAWSYNLLKPSEQRLFRRMSVFVGGFSLDAAEAVASAKSRATSPDGGVAFASEAERNSQLEQPELTPDSVLNGLTSLVDQSLLRVEILPDVGEQFGMFETIREFGLEQLTTEDQGEAETVFRAHATWCVELVEATEPELHGPTQHQWWRLLESEHGNLRAALTWLEQIGDVETSLRIASALSSFWWFGGHLREGSWWLERALMRGEGAPAQLRAKALEGAGFLAQSQGDDERSIALLERSLALYREIADLKGIAATLYSLGVAAEDRGEYDRAADYLTESAARSDELGDHRTMTFARLHLGIVAYGKDDLNSAIEQSELGISLARAIDSTLGGILGTFCLALVATDRAEYAHAASFYRQIVDWLEAAGVFGNAWPRRAGDSAGRTLAGLATLAVGIGDIELAARLFGASAADYEAIGQTPALPERIPFERATDITRKQLGEPAFRTAWAIGERMSPVEAKADIDEVLTKASAWSTPCTTSPATAAGLTPREHDILRLLAEGRTDKEIAAALFISTHTVTGHVAHILAKFDVPNRTAAVNYAVRHDLL